MKKQYQTVMSVEEALMVVSSALKKGAALNVIANALLGDGFSRQKAETILRWAYLKNKRESETQDV